jgi:hydroxybutyrate-dimer hydrolase
MASCAALPPEPRLALVAGIQMRTHAGEDDLLTAGLGEAGLRSATPPAFADADAPSADELRRRAIWSNWRGIADLAPGGGYGEFYGSLAPVPGREYQALAKLPDRQQPHRLTVQLPDAFDAGRRCVVVAASSGSRGVYGAIALAGAWGLPRGCAVAYTDKGAGTGYVDTADGVGIGLDGRRADSGEPTEFAAPVHSAAGIAPIAVKHAHSRDNPEADWGRYVQQAADFALDVLNLAHAETGPWTHENTRVIAVGVSNGGGAILRAAELPGDWLDGAVAISPNVLPGSGGRALFDYGTEAALWMPCALNAPAFDQLVLARPGGGKHPVGAARCASLAAAGQLEGEDPDALASQAHARLREHGWTDEALSAGALSTSFDLWRAVNVTYASAYARTGASDMPCGYTLAALTPEGTPRAPTAAERAAWWSDASGIPPGAGVGIHDGMAAGADAAMPGLACLRAQWEAGAGVVHDSIEATRAGLPRAGLPLVVVHGVDDGLVPEAFSGGAYAAWVKSRGGEMAYWRVRNAQHFDAFLGLPVLGMRYVPIMPFGYHAMDAVWRHVAEGAPLPGDADITTTPRVFDGSALAPLQAENLGNLP